VANQKVRALLAHAVAGTTLRPDEYAVYSVLFENGPTGPTELSRLLGMPATTISGYARTMRDRGHAQRLDQPGDGRAYELALTPTGLAAHAATGTVFATLTRAIEEQLRTDGRVDPPMVRTALRCLGDAAQRSLPQSPAIGASRR
jgi:DNA-binding MarR family transcriptional regulator